MPENTLAKVAGHFHCDPCLVTLQEIRALVQPLIDERTARDLQRNADDVRGAALGGRNGVLGPAEVASALEQGETQTIFVAPHDPIPTGVCSNCEHIDVKAASVCSLCGGEMRIFDDLEEAIARRSGRGTFQLLRVPHGMLDAKCQGFMAGLRFRADRRGTEASSQAA
jgi:hypothetical protein